MREKISAESSEQFSTPIFSFFSPTLDFFLRKIAVDSSGKNSTFFPSGKDTAIMRSFFQMSDSSVVPSYAKNASGLRPCVTGEAMAVGDKNGQLHSHRFHAKKFILKTIFEFLSHAYGKD